MRFPTRPRRFARDGRAAGLRCRPVIRWPSGCDFCMARARRGRSTRSASMTQASGNSAGLKWKARWRLTPPTLSEQPSAGSDMAGRPRPATRRSRHRAGAGAGAGSDRDACATSSMDGQEALADDFLHGSMEAADAGATFYRHRSRAGLFLPALPRPCRAASLSLLAATRLMPCCGCTPVSRRRHRDWTRSAARAICIARLCARRGTM